MNPDPTAHPRPVPPRSGPAPAYLEPLLSRVRTEGYADTLPDLMRHRPPDDPDRPRRRAAVLVLFGHHRQHGPDLLLLERAATLREHAGQAAFPGGGAEPGDGGATGTALREASEETGLDPGGVITLAELPELFIWPSGFLVTPVVAHWPDPGAVRAVDPAETAAVARVPISELVDPAHRVQIRLRPDLTGPGFLAGGLLVWGFTGALLSGLLDLGGWTRPWDTTRVLTVDEGWSAARAATVRRSGA